LPDEAHVGDPDAGPPGALGREQREGVDREHEHEDDAAAAEHADAERHEPARSPDQERRRGGERQRPQPPAARRLGEGMRHAVLLRGSPGAG
jgi:hypothetical protein